LGQAGRLVLFSEVSGRDATFLAAVSSSTRIWSPAAIGMPMITPMTPTSAPNASTLTSTVKPEKWAPRPMIVGCRT
jgi:hypothetical protein